MTADQIVVAAMDEWKAGIDAHDPHRVAAVFAPDAVFQGLTPYGVGRGAVAAYYESQPTGMTVDYRILETRRPTTTVVVGYLAATFAFGDRPPLDLSLGIVLADGTDGWHIMSYQASRVS